MANSGHSVKTFHEANGGQKASRTSAASRLCEAHDRPLEYFCRQCRRAVCGECTALGEHHGHQPIVALKEIAKDLKQSVLSKFDNLKAAHLPQVQRALSDVDKVSSELSWRAEQVRSKIRSSCKCALDSVKLHFEQKLAEVDDLEEIRLKHLGSQKNELKVKDDGLKSMLSRFGEEVLEMDVGTADPVMCDLLFAVDKLANELEKTEVAEQPVEHACLDFEEVEKDKLLTKASALVGEVLPCHASPTHSCVQGDTKTTCTAGSPVNFVVVAKDRAGCRLPKGGDLIRAELTACQTKAELDASYDVLDKTDGTYIISVTAHGHGEYLLNVFVNNVKLQQRLSISCDPDLAMGRFTFDKAECQEEITISANRLTATHTGSDFSDSSVLFRRGMKSGKHVWKVRVGSNTGMLGMLVGVGEEPGITAYTGDNVKYVYGWYGDNGNKRTAGQVLGGTGPWEENDVLQFRLNCPKHTLTITNCRSGETSTITDLPPTELFAYFRSFRNGQSFTLLK